MRIPSIRANIGRREMQWRVRLTPVDAIFGIICIRAKYYIIIIISPRLLLLFTNPQLGLVRRQHTFIPNRRNTNRRRVDLEIFRLGQRSRGNCRGDFEGC